MGLKDLTPGRIGWLAGMIDGEGCFMSIESGRTQSFVIASRYDDMGVEKVFGQVFDLGVIELRNGYGVSSPQVHFSIRTQADCLKSLDTFDLLWPYLITKKRYEYYLWRELVVLSSTYSRLHPKNVPGDDLERMVELANQLRSLKHSVSSVFDDQDFRRMEQLLHIPIQLDSILPSTDPATEARSMVDPMNWLKEVN